MRKGPSSPVGVVSASLAFGLTPKSASKPIQLERWPPPDAQTLRRCLSLKWGRASARGIEASQASLKKARREANEASALGDLRTVLSAQAVYQSSFGHYGELRCLADVKKCQPTYEGTAPNFLDPALAEARMKNLLALYGVAQ